MHGKQRNKSTEQTQNEMIVTRIGKDDFVSEFRLKIDDYSLFRTLTIIKPRKTA